MFTQYRYCHGTDVCLYVRRIFPETTTRINTNFYSKATYLQTVSVFSVKSFKLSLFHLVTILFLFLHGALWGPKFHNVTLAVSSDFNQTAWKICQPWWNQGIIFGHPPNNEIKYFMAVHNHWETNHKKYPYFIVMGFGWHHREAAVSSSVLKTCSHPDQHYIMHAC